MSTRSKEKIVLARVEQRYATARTAIRAIGGVAAAYVLSDIVEAIAGQTTNFHFSVFADLKFAASITVAGLSVVWALRERWLRHRKVEQLQGRIRELEMRIDPHRSSSGLTPKGQTNPRDKRK